MSVPIPRSPEENERIAAMSPDEHLIETSLLRSPYRMEKLTAFISGLENVNVRKVYELSRDKIWPLADTYNSISKGGIKPSSILDTLINDKNDYLDYLQREGKFSTNEMDNIMKSLDITFPTGVISKISASVRSAVNLLVRGY